MVTVSDELQSLINNPAHQDMPLQSIKDDLNELLGTVSGVEVVGPFHVAFNTPGVADTFCPLVDLAAGTTVIRVWAITTEVWDFGGDGVSLTVDVQDPGGTNLNEVYAVDSMTSTPAFIKEASAEPDELGGGTFHVPRVARVPDDAIGWLLAAYIFSASSSNIPTAGGSDFYALIYTP